VARVGASGRTDRGTYWDRLRAMQVEVTSERALGFVRAQPVSSVLVGTTRLEHLRAMVESEPLEPAAVDELRTAFRRHDHGWDGVI